MPDPTDRGDWPWPASLDAVAAAPDSHRVLLENDTVRVVEVTVAPGVREPVHTHRWPSVMLVDEAARIRYYGEEGELEFESPESVGITTVGEALRTTPPRSEWMEPEGPHAVENVDTRRYHAIRVELKDR